MWATLGASEMVFCCLPTILKFPKVEAKNLCVMAQHTDFGIKQVQVCLLRESVSENRISVFAFVKIWTMMVSAHYCYLNSICRALYSDNSVGWNYISRNCFSWTFPVSEWVKSLSRVWLFAIPWTVAYQAPPSTEFSRQEYWSGLPFLSPGGLPDPGIEPRSPAL